MCDLCRFMFDYSQKSEEKQVRQKIYDRFMKIYVPYWLVRTSSTPRSDALQQPKECFLSVEGMLPYPPKEASERRLQSIRTEAAKHRNKRKKAFLSVKPKFLVNSCSFLSVRKQFLDNSCKFLSVKIKVFFLIPFQQDKKKGALNHC